MYVNENGRIAWADDERFTKATRKHTCRTTPGECRACEHAAEQMLRMADGHGTDAETTLYRVLPDEDMPAPDAALTVAQRARWDALDERVTGDASAFLDALPSVSAGQGDPAARWDGSRDAQRDALRAALGADGTGHVRAALGALTDAPGRALPERAKRRSSKRQRVGAVNGGAHARYLRGALPVHLTRSVLGRVTDAYAAVLPTAGSTRPDVHDGSTGFRASAAPIRTCEAGPVVHTTADGATRVYQIVQTVHGGTKAERYVTTAYVPVPLAPDAALTAASRPYRTLWAADRTTREGDALMALREGPGPVRQPSRKGSKGGGRLGTSAVVTSRP